jgi:hypothetical protein
MSTLLITITLAASTCSAFVDRESTAIGICELVAS